jgi:hypothetical protein
MIEAQQFEDHRYKGFLCERRSGDFTSMSIRGTSLGIVIDNCCPPSNYR